MAQTIKLKRSAVAGATPTTASLDLGEIAINTYDGKAYLEKSGSSGYEIQSFVTTDSQTTGSIEITGNISAGNVGAQKGMFTVNYGTGAQITGSLSNGDGYGDIVQLIPMHSDVDAGEVVNYYAGAEWRIADKDSSGQSIKMLGVALEDGDGSNFGKVLLRGFVRLAAGGIADSGGSEGDALYIGDAGAVTFAVPGSGDFARIVGYCIDETLDIIYFNPDNTWVEVA